MFCIVLCVLIFKAKLVFLSMQIFVLNWHYGARFTSLNMLELIT